MCNNCQKKGHLAKICRATRQPRDTGLPKKKSQAHRDAHWVDTGQSDRDNDTDSELPLFKNLCKAVHPNTAGMEINEKALNMEVNTGAAVSIISKATYIIVRHAYCGVYDIYKPSGP